MSGDYDWDQIYLFIGYFSAIITKFRVLRSE